MNPTVPHRWHPYQPVTPQLADALLRLSGNRLDTALREAYDAGWSYEALGDVLGISRQRIAQRISVARYTQSASSIEVPPPWKKEKPHKIVLRRPLKPYRERSKPSLEVA